jgi:hypothetical protein
VRYLGVPGDRRAQIAVAVVVGFHDGRLAVLPIRRPDAVATQIRTYPLSVTRPSKESS